jgi:hypothetical protein
LAATPTTWRRLLMPKAAVERTPGPIDRIDSGQLDGLVRLGDNAFRVTALAPVWIPVA